jgi:hypothetical protein
MQLVESGGDQQNDGQNGPLSAIEGSTNDGI